MAFSGGWFKARAELRKAAREAYGRLAREALRPVWYERHGAVDTFEGRAAMVTAILAVMCARLAQTGNLLAPGLAERINRLVLDGFDAAYRELGVGDHSIARKVRTLAESHAGMGRALMTALETAEPEVGTDPLVAVLVRNEAVLAGQGPELAAALRQLQRALQAQPDAEILAGAFACGGNNDGS